MIRLMMAVVLTMAGTAAQAAIIQPADALTYRQQPGGLAGFEDLFTAALVPDAGVEDRGVVEFNISSVGSAVGQAVLNITLSRNSGVAANTYFVYGYAGDGSVSLLSGDFGAGSGNLLGTFVVTNQSAGTVFDVDVTAYLNTLLGQGADYIGFNVRRSAGPNNDEFEWLGTIGSFAATGFSGPFPTLALTPVPLPPAGPLLLVGLAGLGFVAGRRKAG
jgi:hypothetical protein